MSSKGATWETDLKREKVVLFHLNALVQFSSGSVDVRVHCLWQHNLCIAGEIGVGENHLPKTFAREYSSHTNLELLS